MADLEVTVAQMDEQRVYGLWRKSNDRTLSGDIKILSEKYHATVKIPEGKVFPYFVLSRNYEEQSKDFELLIGIGVLRASCRRIRQNNRETKAGVFVGRCDWGSQTVFLYKMDSGKPI